MYVPFVSSVSTKRVRYKRKGGGGGGRGGGGSSGGSRGGGGGSRGGSSGSGGRPSVSVGSGATTGGRTSARAYGNGGGAVRTIPAGEMFAGRSQGGGTRNDVFGTRTYGSGYPGVASRGVAGLGFPFFFWPVVWGSAAVGGAAYLHEGEYGEPNNSSRPGGQLMTVPLTSLSGNATVFIIADNATTTSLLSSVASNCSSVLASNSTGSQAVLAYDASNDSMPRPEEAIQYYRASSIVLTLDGYNDRTALNASATVNDTHTPLPAWINTTMLDCVNQTIGAAAPLIDDDDSSSAASSSLRHGLHEFNPIGLLWLVVFLYKSFL